MHITHLLLKLTHIIDYVKINDYVRTNDSIRTHKLRRLKFIYQYVKEVSMSIPQDPFILLSYINTQLRDHYKNLTQLCDDLALNETDLVDKLKNIQFEYDEKLNQFK